MNPIHVERFEFIGGPKDGLIVRCDAFPLLTAFHDGGWAPVIPLFIRLERNQISKEGGKPETLLIGRYVCDDPGRERLKYHWLG